MEYVLMLAAGGILLASTFIGWKKGFLKMTLSMLAMIITLALAWMFSPMVTGFIRDVTPLHSITKTAIHDALEEHLNSSSAKTREDYEKILEETFLPSYFVEKIKEMDQESSDEGNNPEVFLDRVSEYVADAVVNICGVVITFIIAGLMINIIMLLLSLVNLIPGLNAVNKIGGGFMGFLQGLIIIWLLCFVITLMAPTELGQEILAAIENNKFLSMVYNGILSFSSVLNFGLMLF